MSQADVEQLISEQDLQVCINAHRQDKASDEHLIQVFSKLARFVLALPSYHFDHPNPESVVAEAADLCLKKMEKYDSTKCVAVNFFVTIIGCYLRQSKRSQMNLRKLKEKHDLMR